MSSIMRIRNWGKERYLRVPKGTNKVDIRLKKPELKGNPYLPEGFIHPRSKRIIEDAFPEASLSPGRYLEINTRFSAGICDLALALNLPDDSPLHLAWKEFTRLATATPRYIHSCRALIQNAARSLVFAERALSAGTLDEETVVGLGEALRGIFEDSCSVMEDLSPEFEVPGIPESFVDVTTLLWNIMKSTELDLRIVCDFNPNVLQLSVPVVIHPELDIAMEDLQLSLISITASAFQLTPVSIYPRCLQVFSLVNGALFEDPVATGEKSLALTMVLVELRRLYTRNAEHIASGAWWIVSTLFGPPFLDEFTLLFDQLQECVELITGRPYDVPNDLLQSALESDYEDFEILWGLNMQAAEADRCRNLRTCGALLTFPQAVRDEIQKAGDRAAGIAAAKQAWKMLQAAQSGSYEHRALTRALYEIRRGLHGSLEEWEFLQSEITIGETLGEGASAAVHAGNFLDGPVAVKLFKSKSTTTSPNSTLSDTLFNTLSSQDMDSYIHKRELQTWFRLSHPHIQPFVGCCLTGDSPMILSPLITHGTARSYRNEHPEADWLKILTQVASGLDYLHREASLVHGDLKGRNVLMDATGSPKISDFGLATMAQNVFGSVDAWGGTAQWMAPELLDRTGFLTYQSDIYALGMTFYELWFDKNPFDLMEPDLVAEMVVEGDARPEREVAPPMPEALWSLLEACWLKTPLERPSSHKILCDMEVISGHHVSTDDAPDAPNIPPGVIVQSSKSNSGTNDETDIDSLPCAPTHELVEFPDRPEFPFESSGYVVSFASRREIETFEGWRLGKPIRHQYVSTPQDAIPQTTTMLHPVERIIFRIQSDTKRAGGIWASWSNDLSQFEAVVLRRNAEGEWDEVPEGTQTVQELSNKCNSTVAHVIVLDSTSKVAKIAVAGDKIALLATPDSRYRLTIHSAEIEMHVSLRGIKHRD